MVHEPPPEVLEEDLELDEPTNPPLARSDNKQERPFHGAPPMVVPSIKGQVKAKKRLRGR